MSAWSSWSSEMVEDSSIVVDNIKFTNYEESNISIEDLKDIADKLKEYYAILDRVLNNHCAVKEVTFKVKGSVAGRATPYSYKIDINAQIFRENREEYLNHRTLGHEYAHIVNANILHGGGHDKNWKFVMEILGLQPSRCHSYDVSHITRKHPRPYVYTCNCREYHLTTRMHNSIVRGAWRRCRHCNAILKYSTKESKVA